MPRSAFVLPILATAAVTAVLAAQTERPGARPPDFSGVYQSVQHDAALPGGLRNAGSPEEIALLPSAVEQLKSVDLTQDPEKQCQPIGPIRMMARPGARIELAYGKGTIVMLFEDISHGHMRTIYLNRSHPREVTPTWHGDSVATWDGATLVIDTVGFNERTWLNAHGVQHSDALHLTERVKPVLDGNYLEYTATFEDANVLAKPYTYTRYFERLRSELGEDVCEP